MNYTISEAISKSQQERLLKQAQENACYRERFPRWKENQSIDRVINAIFKEERRNNDTRLENLI